MAAIGERTRVAGLALAGVTVLVAEEPESVRRAWQDLPPDVALVIVTPAAADTLGPALLDCARPLTAVLPV
ncbi:V-type ATP synthase subunit F [Streptomyces sp. NBC_01340]|uniref:V-type ATP synthase subunit F n=1 Tax=unclassified Streptomyces TaxID=2593676 RepID=UPI002258554D|nr:MULTISPECIES: V-type ATP synthase subunit F [unclassified Streptomyces]MCX4462057.1 V-type ATP synthase subunit F [Streptomyces sp. NBC_01719]MCX4490965.1 V-type ATP synthase subunit F [Streptomyces sp. NBC_01728]WSI36300.1 V-type ATP synthase subunit F [Streptomyces sp. NBC_01340]